MVQLTVVNRELQIGSIRIIGLGNGSVFQIGDTSAIHASSVFDTPPDSIVISPLVPFQAEE